MRVVRKHEWCALFSALLIENHFTILHYYYCLRCLSLVMVIVTCVCTHSCNRVLALALLPWTNFSKIIMENVAIKTPTHLLKYSLSIPLGDNVAISFFNYLIYYTWMYEFRLLIWLNSFSLILSGSRAKSNELRFCS